MIQLQNNFTTPEQSKRLLELGVPADSADCFYDKQFMGGNIVQTRMFNTWRISHDLFCGVLSDIVTPCWSVGRLMAIYFISKGIDYWSPQFKKYQIENSVEYFVAIIEENIKDLDFSKLEK